MSQSQYQKCGEPRTFRFFENEEEYMNLQQRKSGIRDRVVIVRRGLAADHIVQNIVSPRLKAIQKHLDFLSNVIDKFIEGTPDLSTITMNYPVIHENTAVSQGKQKEAKENEGDPAYAGQGRPNRR